MDVISKTTMNKGRDGWSAKDTIDMGSATSNGTTGTRKLQDPDIQDQQGPADHQCNLRAARGRHDDVRGLWLLLPHGRQGRCPLHREVCTAVARASHGAAVDGDS